MKTEIERRTFLSRIWKWGFGLVAVAGAWTTWDILQPASPSGFGGLIKNGKAAEVPSTSVETISAAQAYVTKAPDDEVVALWWRCPHLGCRVPWCESAGEFECPCHGSRFNRLGEYRAGPSPRGMDRFAIEIVDEAVLIDTGTIENGPPPGPETIDEPVGPPCEGGDHG
ncbi:MAG: Rieske 2Fe-2S domain-containing protein [Actinomycetia bacterium]|nr:Rieske 2Fe-2S domain-containing protein [Actinomycetes bacterium]